MCLKPFNLFNRFARFNRYALFKRFDRLERLELFEQKNSITPVLQFLPSSEAIKRNKAVFFNALVDLS